MSADEGSGALAAIARSREANPAFAISLGSKELFHSNLIAWFLQHHRPVAEALGMRGEVTVLREKNHTDLLIRHGQQQQVTVIENKVSRCLTPASSPVWPVARQALPPSSCC